MYREGFRVGDHLRWMFDDDRGVVIRNNGKSVHVSWASGDSVSGGATEYPVATWGLYLSDGTVTVIEVEEFL